MPIEVIMPKVDMDMASGIVSVWHIDVGASVSKGEPLFDIETDKAAMEVEAQHDGFLYHPVDVGTEVQIGQPVAWLYAEGEVVGDDRPQAETLTPDPKAEPDQPKASASEAPAETTTSPQPALSGKVRATPLARSRAHAAGIDMATLEGTGPLGRIQADDVPQREQLVEAILPASFTPEAGPLSVSHKKGGTGRPIVLIHGFASDAKSWAPLEPYLSNHPLIRIDLPCHGKSPKQRIGSFTALLRTLRDAFDDLHLDAAHIIGHSLGGALALALADTRPRGISSLSLIAPAGLGPKINGATLMGIANASREASLKPWLKTLVYDDTLITEGYTKAAMANRSNSEMRAAQIAMADSLFPDSTQAIDLKSAVERVEMPVRLIWGRRDDIIPWQHALVAPGRAALHLFDATGHLPHIELTDEIGKLLQSSL